MVNLSGVWFSQQQHVQWHALLKYFKKASVLSNPNGPLSSSVPPSSIVLANKEVKPLLDKCPSDGGGCGKYLVYTEKEKFKRAAEINTIRHFQNEFSDWPLKEITVDPRLSEPRLSKLLIIRIAGTGEVQVQSSRFYYSYTINNQFLL